jgi:uncharacterized protein YndB with AHSA1/START domain
VACDGAERNAFLGRDVMEQLALVLREVFGVGLEKGTPQPSVQLVELFGLRLVRHAVQSNSSGGKGFGGRLAMIEIARERNISAPAARVWEVVSEAERLPEWYARAASVEVLEGAGLGRRQRLRSEWRGQDSEVDQLITAFEPEHLLEWRHEAERLGGQPAPRFALETVVRIKLEAQGPDATRVVLESRQRPADAEKEQAMRGNSEYLGKMLEESLERLEQLVTRDSHGAATST